MSDAVDGETLEGLSTSDNHRMAIVLRHFSWKEAFESLEQARENVSRALFYEDTSDYLNRAMKNIDSMDDWANVALGKEPYGYRYSDPEYLGVILCWLEDVETSSEFRSEIRAIQRESEESYRGKDEQRG